MFVVGSTPCLVIPILYGDSFHTKVYMEPRTIYKADDDNFGVEIP